MSLRPLALHEGLELVAVSRGSVDGCGEGLGLHRFALVDQVAKEWSRLHRTVASGGNEFALARNAPGVWC